MSVPPASLERARRLCAAAALAGAALCALGAWRDGPLFFRAYLWAFMLFFGLGSGCLGLLLLHRVVGGQWGELIGPALESGAETVPWLALAFAPLLLGLSRLYPWARPAEVAADPVLRHLQPYLNAPFFAARAAAGFAVWWGLIRSARERAAPGLVVYFLTLTPCLLDWTMSLEPRWYSTVYELMMIAGQGLSALALCVATLAVLGGGRRLSDALPSKPFLDLGNLLLAFVLLWAYASFAQYLIIWSGDAPREIAWYLRRQEGVWFAVGLALVAAQFAAPLLLLLARANKRRLDRLALIAGLLVAGRALELQWLIKPAFGRAGPPLHWLDAAAALGLGGAWAAVFLGRLAARPSPVGAVRAEAA